MRELRLLEIMERRASFCSFWRCAYRLCVPNDKRGCTESIGRNTFHVYYIRMVRFVAQNTK